MAETINDYWKLPYTAEQLQAAVENQIPIIGENGNWWIWDIENQAFKDTGVKAEATGTVNSVNGVSPVDGNVTLTAADVGALPESSADRITALETGKLDAPADVGTPGQVLTKTAEGLAWADATGGLLPQLIVTTTPGASVSATLGETTIGPVVAGGDGIATLELTAYGEWALTAEHEDYPQAGGNTVTVDTVRIYEATVMPSGIPRGYTQLEYIGSTGTQYIDLDLSGAGRHRIVGSVMWTANSSGALLGRSFSGSSPTTVEYLHRTASSEFPYQLVVGNADGPYRAAINPTTNAKYEIDASSIGTVSNGTWIKLNGNSYSLTKLISGSDDKRISDLNCYLFASNSDGTAAAFAKARIYGAFKIYTTTDDTGLVSELYPVKRDSDDVVGMYDLVTNTFFTNAGSGDFIAGPEV